MHLSGGKGMSVQKYEYKQVNVTELLLNPENPRFDPVKHQTETISAMVKDQKEKLSTLAKHIINNGLNPTDIILVRPYQNQWLVLEGNRRVTALKLVNEPDLVPSQYAKLKRDFQKLNAVLDKGLLEHILCVVIEDTALANKWIRLKHTGENDGAGTVRWDGQQTSRFSAQTSGNVDNRIVFLDELKTRSEIPQAYKDAFSSIKKTNFDRLMGDPDVRALLGIDIENEKFILSNGVNTYLLFVLYDLAIADLSVGEIYHKNDRKKYIEELQQKAEQQASTPAGSVPAAGSDSKESPDGSSSDDPGQRNSYRTTSTSTNTVSQREPSARTGSAKSYPINRKPLIPAQHRLAIAHARIVKIFNELKQLDTDTYPNAVSVLFRVFIELSADCYIAKNSTTGVNTESRLGKKIEAVTADLENKQIMTANELRGARQMVSSPTQNNSIKTFHSYVHNRDITPSSTDLKSAWDDLWPFIECMWR